MNGAPFLDYTNEHFPNYIPNKNKEVEVPIKCPTVRWFCEIIV